MLAERSEEPFGSGERRLGAVEPRAQLHQLRAAQWRQGVKADGRTARIERRQRAGVQADRLRRALQRRLGFLAAGQIEDQEWGVEPLGVARGDDRPAGGAGCLCDLDRQLRLAGDHDQPVAAAGRRLGVIGAVAPVLGVLVVPAAALAAVAARGDGLDRDRRRSPARLAEALLVERAGDVEPDVDANKVHQLEGAHPEPAAEPADAVDLVDRGDPLGDEAQALQAERAVAPIDEEADAVNRFDHVLAHRFAGGARQRDRVRCGFDAGHYFQQCHHRRRIEEVHADDAFGVRQRRRDGGHEQR